MSKHPNRTYGVNPETLLLLAWCSTLDLRALLENDQKARPWKYPLRQPWDEWYPVFNADILRQPIAEALTRFNDEPYGPILCSLVEYRLVFVDVEEVAHTMSLQKLAEPGHALYYDDDAYESNKVGRQREQGPRDETDAFWQALSHHEAVHIRLIRQSETWNQSTCQGARFLRTFFSAYPKRTHVEQKAPFFVSELLFMSLKQIDWHCIAANLLQKERFPCTCTQHKLDDGPAQVALFQALLTTLGHELCQVSGTLPDSKREIALFLSDLCKHSLEPDVQR